MFKDNLLTANQSLSLFNSEKKFHTDYRNLYLNIKCLYHLLENKIQYTVNIANIIYVQNKQFET